MRARRGFGVILDGKQRKCFVPKAFDGSVVQIEVGDLEIGGSRYPGNTAFYGKTMILRGDQDLSGWKVLDRVIPSPMPVRKLDRAPTVRDTKELVAEADAERRQP